MLFTCLLYTSIVYLLFAAIGLLSGYGIIAVAVANLISVIVNRVLAVYFFRRGEILGQLKQTSKSGERLFPIIWFNAKKVGIGSVGSYFVQRGNVLFVSIFLPLDVVANFGLTSQVMNILAALTPLYLTAHLPEIYRDRINQNFYEIRRIFAESVFVFIISYAAIAAVVLFGGNFLLDLLKSETRLIPFFPVSYTHLDVYKRQESGVIYRVPIQNGERLPAHRRPNVHGSFRGRTSTLP